MPKQSETHGKSGQPTKHSGDKSTRRASDSKDTSRSSTRGRTHEQHVKAGQAHFCLLISGVSISEIRYLIPSSQKVSPSTTQVVRTAPLQIENVG